MYACGPTFSIFHFLFFLRIFFLGLLWGATYVQKNIFHEGGLFIVHKKNVVIKEALAFESPGFLLIFKKTGFPLISFAGSIVSGHASLVASMCCMHPHPNEFFIRIAFLEAIACQQAMGPAELMLGALHR